MSEPPRLLRYLRFLRPNARAEADEEIGFHLDMRVRDLMARGLSLEQAREKAQHDFGDMPMIREEVIAIDERRGRRTRRREWLEDFTQDLRLSARSLRRSPGFTFMATTCVALGIAVTTTIFAAVNAILIRPLPFSHPEELVSLYARLQKTNEGGINISWPDYISWRDNNRTMSAMGIWTWTSVALSGEGEAERVEGAYVGANVFPILGVRPMLGRYFTEQEEIRGNDRVILLGHDIWTRRYASDSTIVGKAIQVDGVAYTVVGVMPPHFNFPQRGSAWVPFSVNPAEEEHGNRGYAGAIARLKPGVTVEQAQADMDRVSAALATEFPRDNFGWDAEVQSMRDDLVGDMRKPLEVFLVAVVFVLLIASANVANLMLARGVAREQETAVRIALGAGRGRIVRQVLTESLSIAALGGAIGVLLARYGVQLLALAFPDGAPYFINIGLDKTAALFAVVVTATSAAIFGVGPALAATRRDVQHTLRDSGGGRSAGGSKERGRLRSSLVLAEVALSVVLLISAGLLIRSYQALISTNLGFDEKGILSARLTLPDAKYATFAARRAMWDQLYERVAAIPGVDVVGSAQGIPLSGWNVQAQFSIEGRPPQPQGEELVIHYQAVNPDYFKAIGVPVLRGRGFTSQDRDSALRIVVINEILARKEFPNEDPIGKRVKFGSAEESHDWYTIVGLVGDFRHYRLTRPMGPAMYMPWLVEPYRSQTLALRTKLADPLALVPALRTTVQSLDPDLPIYTVQTFEQAVSRSLWRERFQGQVLGVFAALALLLATVGIYGIIAWSVTQRTRELGVRMALGASGRSVVTMVLGQGTKLALAGVIVGLIGAFALTRLLAELLHGVGTVDPLTFVGVPLLLLAVAAVACVVPARRASKVDPTVAMRAD